MNFLVTRRRLEFRRIFLFTSIMGLLGPPATRGLENLELDAFLEVGPEPTLVKMGRLDPHCNGCTIIILSWGLGSV